MTNKEQLLFQSARQILQDHCPKHQEYYFCKKYIDDTDEIRCTECWENYLIDILNGKLTLG